MKAVTYISLHNGCDVALKALRALCLLALAALLAVGTLFVLKARQAAEEVRHTAEDQRRLLDAETAERDRLTKELRRALTCDRVGKMGKGKDAIECSDVGVLPQVARAAGAYANAAVKLERMVARTDAALNCPQPNASDCPKRGALVELAQQIEKNGSGLAEAIGGVNALTAKLNDGDNGLPSLVLEGRDAVHELGNLAGDRNLHAGFAAGAHAMQQFDQDVMPAAAQMAENGSAASLVTRKVVEHYAEQAMKPARAVKKAALYVGNIVVRLLTR